MRKLSQFILCIMMLSLLFGCKYEGNVDIAATTLPVYEFTVRICEGTDLTIGRVITENVSCLHDYTLQVNQMRMLESANSVVISGAGLESFLEDALVETTKIIDASTNTHIHDADHHDHSHEGDEHHHENDPHIWLSPENARTMADNIASELSTIYPQHKETFEKNLNVLHTDLNTLQQYGNDVLSSLSSRELITFHDGFAYLAESFDLTILQAIEEESGSEASASELKELILLVEQHNLQAVFTECNGSSSAADVIAAETGCSIYTLDMAMSGSSYFDAMYHNIDTLKEALG